MINEELANPLDLRGRTVLVTGASGGLGRATAVLASRLGARLVLLGRSVERLEETRAQLAGDGHVSTVYDLHELAGLPPCLKAAVSEAGPLFGMAHCAGFLDVRPLRFLSDEAIEEMLRVNTLSAMALARAFRAKGVSTRPASVVFVSSIMGLVGQPGQVAYSASKGALVALTRSLALEFATEGLRCNCVAPGVVEAGMTHGWRADIGEEAYARVGAAHPLGFGTADDVAHAIVFLLSDAARWITGTTLAVDGGYTAQ